MFYKIRVIFSRKQKLKFIILAGILFVGSLLEFMGVSLILPFVQLVMEPEGEYGEEMMVLEEFLGVGSRRELLFLTGALLIVVYVVKNVYLLFMKYVQFRFIFNNRLELSGRLMGSYMKKPYPFHLQKNSSEVLRSVTADVNNLYELLMDGIDLFSNLLMIGMLIVFLVCMDPVITLVVVFLLGMCSLIYFQFMRNAEVLKSGTLRRPACIRDQCSGSGSRDHRRLCHGPSGGKVPGETSGEGISACGCFRKCRNGTLGKACGAHAAVQGGYGAGCSSCFRQ